MGLWGVDWVEIKVGVDWAFGGLGLNGFCFGFIKLLKFRILKVTRL